MIRRVKELEIGGISFGLTSGVITTLGAIVGLSSATGSKIAVLSAILTIAVADSLSDALGIHLSEESRVDEKKKPIWIITIFTFIGKLIFSLIFVLPIIFLDLKNAVWASLAMGLISIIALAMYIAKRRQTSIVKEVFEYSFLTILVLILSYFVGHLADKLVH